MKNKLEISKYWKYKRRNLERIKKEITFYKKKSEKGLRRKR